MQIIESKMLIIDNSLNLLYFIDYSTTKPYHLYKKVGVTPAYSLADYIVFYATPMMFMIVRA